MHSKTYLVIPNFNTKSGAFYTIQRHIFPIYFPFIAPFKIFLFRQRVQLIYFKIKLYRFHFISTLSSSLSSFFPYAFNLYTGGKDVCLQYVSRISHFVLLQTFYIFSLATVLLFLLFPVIVWLSLSFVFSLFSFHVQYLTRIPRSFPPTMLLLLRKFQPVVIVHIQELHYGALIATRTALLIEIRYR